MSRCEKGHDAGREAVVQCRTDSVTPVCRGAGTKGMQNKARKALLTAAAACLMAGTAGAAEIYKWVDADGNVHYGDVPEGKAAEALAIDSRRSDPDRVQAQQESVAKLQENLAERAEAREEADAAREEARAEAEKQAKQCEEARERLRIAMEAQRLYKEDESGERIWYEDADYERLRSEARDLVEERCAGR